MPGLRRSEPGSGWQIFHSIVGAGDFSGDGNNDVPARDRAGKLFLYPGDGHGGWLPPSQVGSGWQIFNKIVAPGNTNGDGGVDIFARDNRGVLHQYPTDGHGGWKPPTVVGPGWEGMTEINGAGRFSGSILLPKNPMTSPPLTKKATSSSPPAGAERALQRRPYRLRLEHLQKPHLILRRKTR